MNIEAGKNYLRRDGKISGVILKNSDDEHYRYIDSEDQVIYDQQGRSFVIGCRNHSKDNDFDLMEEV